MTASAQPGRGIRVVIVEDHPLFAESLVIALRSFGHAATRVPLEPDARGQHPGLVGEVLRRRPDLVLVDLDLAGHGDGLDVVAPLAQSGIAVAVVTGETDRARWGECLDRGAHAVIPKRTSLGGVVDVIGRAVAGEPLMPPGEREGLQAAWRQRVDADRELRRAFDRLSRREAEVLGMLMSGWTVSEVARRSFVSVATVRTQVKSVLLKLQVGSQLAAVGLANEVGWRPPDLPTRQASHWLDGRPRRPGAER